MVHHKILIIEDIASLSMAYAGHLESAGFESFIVDNLADANSQLQENRAEFSAVLLDLQLPDGNGLDWLAQNPDIVQDIPIIVATADGSINRAIDAMRLGAYDFMVKPLAPARLVTVIKGAAETKREAKPAAAQHSNENIDSDALGGFIGASQPMQSIYNQIKNVAKSKATIFITGESGTGKEVCADAIHKSGPRAKKPFVAINCGAIPEDLLESELFGHLKGSFTGAISDRVGAVQAAHGGTLFLDEICEMELKLQVKLLRFLQTGTVQRVGATKAENVDVRIICATNRTPSVEVQHGRFREDLYYRLAVVPIHLPALRERGNDITLLANSFLDRFANEEGKSFSPLNAQLAQKFEQHSWPGNVRELQNLMRRAAVMFAGPELDETIVSEFTAASPQVQSINLQDQNSEIPLDQFSENKGIDQFDNMTLDQVERLLVDRAVQKCGGSLTKAAKKLGVSPSTLYRKKEKWASSLPADF